MNDPGLRFLLHYIEACGGLWELAGDSTLAILPPELATRYQLPEEVVVTDDPDIARADGHVFLGTGHPVLTQAAESVLRDGDVGVALLQRPAGPPPGKDVLEANARAQVPVNHGRLDVAGPANVAVHWLLRVGAMVSYAMSSDDYFTERVERWVHVAEHREVPADVVSRLAGPPMNANSPMEAVPGGQLVVALAEADRLIADDALRRRTDLARQLRGSHDAERARTTSYYADAQAAIQRRLDAAPPDRRALLEARLASTREEQGRRLVEITEKYQARHEITPYRLHAIAVPALRVPIDVRRGERRYRMELDWLLPARVFAQTRCPSCASAAPLVAGKNALGCLLCQETKVSTVAPARAGTPAPLPRPAAQALPQAADLPNDDPVPRRGAGPAPNRRAPTVAPPTARSKAGTPAVVRASALVKAAPAGPAPQRADNVAVTVWNAVAAGRARGLRNALAVDSPAAALCTLYGTDGIKLAIGLPVHDELVGFTTGSTRVGDGWGATTGSITTRWAECQYHFRWQEQGRALSIVEVLPHPVHADGRFPYFWWLDDDSPYRVTRLPPPTGRLDDVARHLFNVGAPWHGLAIAARALAAWWRLSKHHDRLLDTHPSAVLAAAVHRLICHRAGGKGLYRDVSEGYRVDESAIRSVDAQLRKLLGLGPDRAW